jgi:hypothetical protein
MNGSARVAAHAAGGRDGDEALDETDGIHPADPEIVIPSFLISDKILI